jgi:hypothetical protein
MNDPWQIISEQSKLIGEIEAYATMPNVDPEKALEWIRKALADFDRDNHIGGA